MDREAWQATVHGVARARHDFAIKPTYLRGLYHPQPKILSLTPKVSLSHDTESIVIAYYYYS